MKNKILVDLGIIVEYLKTGKGVLPVAYEKYKMMITPLTYSELLASATFQDESLEKEVMEFVEKYFDVIDLDAKVGLEVARVLRDNDITMVSAVIAAAAKVNAIEVLTDDKKTFEKIDGVTLVDL